MRHLLSNTHQSLKRGFTPTPTLVPFRFCKILLAKSIKPVQELILTRDKGETKKPHQRWCRGFTLAEIVTVVAILSILMSVALPSFSGFRNSKILDATSEEILAVLSTASANTLSAKNGDPYGVHFENLSGVSKFVLYRGVTYSSSDVNNVVYMLDSKLEISNISLVGGAVDVLFDPLTGKTTQSGTVIVRVKATPTILRTITINGTGIASVN
ncbi:MAG: prepilin-type N-terminal cleavage/methylation domain-containing protein [bacterium]|nr:prepilin-type N-terminal cleavage/methylation domain-containing protein [bacterium]